jgi:outer membrane receptor protein involved in Fe transport
LNSKHLFKGGINYRLVFFRQLGKFWLNDSVSVSFIDHRGNSSLMQSFFHWQYRAGEKLELNSGLYSQLFLLNKTKSVEPRFSVNYQLSKNQRISFAYGLHSQIHPLQYYFTQLLNPETGTYTLENKNLDMTRSQHWVVGYTHLFNDRLQLKTEVYYQYLSDVPVSLEQGNGFFSMLTTGGDNALWLANGLINKGTGRNYGIEFTAERYFNKDFYFLATASLFDSRYRGMDGILRHTPFSIGHITNLLAGKEFKLDEGKRKVISVDMKACFLGGRRYIPVNMDSTIEARRLVLDVSRAYEEKLKSQLRFDFRISYNVNLPKVTHNVFVAADNLFGAKNMLNQYWNDKTQSIQKDYQIGLFPYCGYRIHF